MYSTNIVSKYNSIDNKKLLCPPGEGKEPNAINYGVIGYVSDATEKGNHCCLEGLIRNQIT